MEDDIEVRDAEKKLFRQLLIKKSEYSGEEEWRIITCEQKIPFAIISAIYMGHKIELEQED